MGVVLAKVAAARGHPNSVALGKGGGSGFNGSGRQRQAAPVTGDGGGEVLQHEAVTGKERHKENDGRGGSEAWHTEGGGAPARFR
jgi:hypothetical protein